MKREISTFSLQQVQGDSTYHPKRTSSFHLALEARSHSSFANPTAGLGRNGVDADRRFDLTSTSRRSHNSISCRCEEDLGKMGAKSSLSACSTVHQTVFHATPGLYCMRGRAECVANQVKPESPEVAKTPRRNLSGSLTQAHFTLVASASMDLLGNLAPMLLDKAKDKALSMAKDPKNLKAVKDAISAPKSPPSNREDVPAKSNTSKPTKKPVKPADPSPKPSPIEPTPVQIIYASLPSRGRRRGRRGRHRSRYARVRRRAKRHRRLRKYYERQMMMMML
ncbi:unnamed protein product [Protopolystoma xenopodis]|uniref:Uncharacterized protein n=1 Tax=Protopolystoma xenopodis TaxID=117903 RepID=A0A3S5CQI5_9PLAT|nr:unnamed protein product [Protopolystoma xenopodis]